MFRSSQGFVSPGESSPQVGEARLRWLRGTKQLDVMGSKLRDRATALTRNLNSEREKAVAVHDFVKALPFGCVPDYSITASEVLHLGHGDCFTKGMLLVALLRAAQVPARLRFVSLPVNFLRGIVEPEEATIMHAMSEVLLDGRWLVTDSYVPDHALHVGARRKLAAEGQNMGYGIHINGAQHWDGTEDASAQCSLADTASLPVVDWGIADDPESFYADKSHSELRRNFATRLKWRLAAPMVNKRVAAVRAGIF
jgi:hypothetical protein